jgi:predicted MFS family arabinose efflux permease
MVHRDIESTDWRAVFLLTVAGIISAAHLVKLAPALFLIKQHFELSLSQLGWTISAFNLIGAVAAVALGIVVDAIGCKKAVLAGLLLLLLGDLLGGVTKEPALFVASRILEGCGFVITSTAAPALITKVTARQNHRIALGIWSVYMGLGGALMFTASGALLSITGWRTLWWALAAIVVILWLAIAMIVRPPLMSDNVSAISREWLLGAKKSLSSACPWLLMMTFASYTAMWYSVLTWLPTFTANNSALGLSASTFLTAIVIAANVPGNLFAAWLLHKKNNREMLMLIGASVMLLSELIIFTDEIPIAARYITCIIFSLFGGLLVPSFFSATPRYAATPRHVALINGLLLQGSNMGQVIAPILIANSLSVKGNFAGTGPIMHLFGAIAVLCSIYFWLYESKTRVLVA